MKKLFLALAAAAIVLAATQPTLAQYGYGYGNGNGMGAGAWFAMMVLGLVYFIIVSLIFSWIFWMVGAKMMESAMEKKWMEKTQRKSEMNTGYHDETKSHSQN